MANQKKSRKTLASKGSEKANTPKLEDLQQTTGKSYEDKVARAKELEEILGIPKISPFKTHDREVFASMIKEMNLTDLQAFAVKVGIFPSGNKTILRNKIKRAFESSLVGQGSVQVMGDPIKLDPSNPEHKKVIDYLGG